MNAIETKHEVTVPLAETGLSARIVVTTSIRGPDEGDDVGAGYRIYLPAGEYGSLHPDLRFGDRLRVCDSRLIATWGMGTAGHKERSTMGNDEPIIGDTHAAARAKALEAASTDLGNLIQALRDRAAALAKVGD